MLRNNPTLLLTACVNPNGMYFTALQDSSVRYKQYVEALKFYLENTSLQIVFIDNSGCDMSSEFNQYIQEGRLEVLFFEGNDFDKHLGKGFGEMLIINYALEHSKLITQSDYILKITGRLKLLNIQRVIQQAASINDLDVLANLLNMLSHADSRCFLARRAFFCDLVRFKDRINDSVNITFEHIFLSTIHRRVEQGYKFCINRNFLHFSGMSGTSGNTFNTNIFRYFWKDLRSKIRYYLLK